MNNTGEIRIEAQAVSRGISIGTAICLYGHRRQYFRTKLPEDRIAKELRRFRAAIRLAIRQLGRLGQKSPTGAGNTTGILDFHRMMLADPAFLQEIQNKITGDKINAEWAVKLVTDSYLAHYNSVADDKLRERQADIEDITERILTALGGGRKTSNHLERGSIVVSRDLNPSTIIELSENDPAAIVTEHGGWTSHTFILAREMGIPAVTGVKRALRRIHTGDQIIVDGFRGEIIVRPTAESLASYREPKPILEHQSKVRNGHAGFKTIDGREIIIRANADIIGGYERGRSYGAQGVGLFRSEYIFNRFRGIPSEEEQFETYRRIAELTSEHGVRIRTFDFGSEDLAEQSPAKCKNPALGLRAIRLSLDHEAQFRDQVRALLRAAFQTNIDIILPMISDIAEIRQVKAILNEERAKLARDGRSVGTPRLGAMVEVPSTVLMIEELLDEVDVICLGTNDLVQYLLAVDRDNEAVAGWFRTLSPAVIRAVSTVVSACAKRSIPCVVCGEMAGSPYYVPLLIGLGAVELSMNPKSIPRIQRLISGIAFEETLKLRRSVENCRTAAEIEETNKTFIAAHWSHLYEIAPERP
jgi:phosphotransferase system enzyme I (PtsI)